MMTKPLLTFLVGALSLFLAACTTSRLRSLAVDGPELHPALMRKQLDGAKHGVPQGVRENPYVSTDVEVVESIARHASQGQFDGDGISAALYALYQFEREVGFYALEADSTDDADRLEGRLRGIWAHNVGLGIARVHRGGRILLVVWNDGVSPACWQAVNDGLVERLTAR